jgi:hypothetical protein
MSLIDNLPHDVVVSGASFGDHTPGSLTALGFAGARFIASAFGRAAITSQNELTSAYERTLAASG